jgi:peptide/nickel transport system substrate-binding protein
VTRRRFLQICALTTSGLALSAACAPAAPPAAPGQTAAKPTTAAEAPKPTAAPAVVPTIAPPAGPLPTAAPAAAPTAAAKPAANVPTGSITVIQALPITTLDPSIQQGVANLNPAINMMDPLVFREPDGSVKPFLATEWSYPDEKTLRFKIRKGIKFHNGDEMTPEDVIFTYKRILDPQLKSGHYTALNVISDIKAVDAETVDFQLKQSDATLLGRLSILPILPKKYFDSVGGTDAFGQKPVGTGPWKFVEWQKGQKVVMEANPDYWQGPPKIKTITYREISEANTRITELLTGNADIVNTVSPELADRIKAEPKTALQTVRSLRNVYLKINTKKKPFDDLKVRQAIAHAIDVPLIILSVLGGNAVATPGGVEGVGVWGYFKGLDKGYEYNPEQSKQLLADAGVKQGTPIMILSAKGRLLNDSDVVQAMAGMLQQVGFNPSVQLLDFTVVNDEWNAKYREEMDLHLWSNANNTADADYNYTTNFISTNNGLYWSTPEVDALILKAKATLDPNARMALYQDIGQKILDACPIVPLYDQVDSYGTSKRLKDFQARSDELINLRNASVDG